MKHPLDCYIDNLANKIKQEIYKIKCPEEGAAVSYNIAVDIDINISCVNDKHVMDIDTAIESEKLEKLEDTSSQQYLH